LFYCAQGYAIVQIYIFPRFPGFRGSLPAPLPNGNPLARALPIGARLVCEKHGRIFSYENQLEIRFGRNEKENMAENPFARSVTGSVASSPNGSESPITAARGCCKQPTGFFRQIFLVVKPKSDFHVVYNVPLYFCL